MKNHILKIWPEYFEKVVSGEKTFEIRKNDRGYEIGDLLVLKEFNPKGLSYTGRQIVMKITYITDFAQADNHVVMGIMKYAQNCIQHKTMFRIECPICSTIARLRGDRNEQACEVEKVGYRGQEEGEKIYE